ncbi:MAG: hypothetical protein ACHP7H_00995 [Hyphomicrobiales bacterium]
MMLPLNDPLWNKLDDAHRDRCIPDVLAGLAESWNDEAANSLFWDCLCHQETCYGATYAAIPHLLNIAKPDENEHQRLQIALFAGFVALCALRPRKGSSEEIESRHLPGLPLTLEAWDRKLDTFRSLVASFEGSNGLVSRYERLELLPRYKRLLAIEPVHAGDLTKIRSIQVDFFSALPMIRSVCEHALVENLDDKHAVSHMLCGIAAADGLLNLARLLNSGSDGQFTCSRCGCRYQYILFGDQVAIYVCEGYDEARSLRDFKERTPTRCDGFMTPTGENEILDARTVGLLSLAKRASSPEPALLLRSFLGSFRCCKCGAQGAIQAI